MKGTFVNIEFHKGKKSDLEEILKALPIVATLDAGDEEPNISEEEMRYRIHQNLRHGYDDFTFYLTPLQTGNVEGVSNYMYDPTLDPGGELSWNASYFDDELGLTSPALSVIFRGNNYTLFSKY